MSHWWGAPFEKSMQSICKHAQLAGGNKWKELAYWCCLFSVNQWRMEDELGNGDLARSSFYLALTDPMTRATLLLLDDEVGCLSRSWCLFEVLQTCLRSPGTTLDRSWSGFEGLLLCTPSGVMNKETGQPGSHVSIDTAILTAQRLVHLRFEDAQATNPADKEIIDIVVGRYVGKQLAMNGLVQHHIREALSSIKEKHNRTFAKLMNELGPVGHHPQRSPVCSGILPRMRVHFLVSADGLPGYFPPTGSDRANMRPQILTIRAARSDSGFLGEESVAMELMITDVQLQP